MKAVEYAKEHNCEVVAITGYNGGRLREFADYNMHVAVDDMQIVEDLHMSFCHMMYHIFKDIL